jgi:hypothetical protein
MAMQPACPGHRENPVQKQTQKIARRRANAQIVIDKETVLGQKGAPNTGKLPVYPF